MPATKRRARVPTPAEWAARPRAAVAPATLLAPARRDRRGSAVPVAQAGSPGAPAVAAERRAMAAAEAALEREQVVKLEPVAHRAPTAASSSLRTSWERIFRGRSSRSRLGLPT